MSRLPAPHGTAIDRERPLSFSFEGRTIRAFAGDTIASALAANGSGGREDKDQTGASLLTVKETLKRFHASEVRKRQAIWRC